MTTDSTRALAERAKGGDREAFDALVERFADRLGEYIRYRMGPQVREKLDPEDVFQETLVRAFQSIRRLEWRDEAAFARWLESIAEHRIRDALKGPRGAPVLELPPTLAASRPSPSKIARRNERFDRLKQSLDSLSPDHRQVILLARIEGLKIKEVARRMNRSESAVKNLLLRALRELKGYFGETGSLNLPDRSLGGSSGPSE